MVGKKDEGGLRDAGGKKQEETYVRTYCIVLLCSCVLLFGSRWVCLVLFVF